MRIWKFVGISINHLNKYWTIQCCGGYWNLYKEDFPNKIKRIGQKPLILKKTTDIEIIFIPIGPIHPAGGWTLVGLWRDQLISNFDPVQSSNQDSSIPSISSIQDGHQVWPGHLIQWLHAVSGRQVQWQHRPHNRGASSVTSHRPWPPAHPSSSPNLQSNSKE